MKLPSRGAYVVSQNNELAAVIGYDLDRHESYLRKAKDTPLREAEAFAEAVSRGAVPLTPRDRTIVVETWELYGLPSGPLEEMTRQLGVKLESGDAVTPES